MQTWSWKTSCCRRGLGKAGSIAVELGYISDDSSEGEIINALLGIVAQCRHRVPLGPTFAQCRPASMWGCAGLSGLRLHPSFNDSHSFIDIYLSACSQQDSVVPMKLLSFAQQEGPQVWEGVLLQPHTLPGLLWVRVTLVPEMCRVGQRVGTRHSPWAPVHCELVLQAAKPTFLRHLQ